MQSDLSSLLSRLEVLERGQRRARRVAVAAVVAALAWPTLAFVVPPQSPAPAAAPAQDTGKKLDTVRAAGFEVVDAAGKVRARLALDRDGAPELRLFDAKEKVRMRLGIHKDTDPILTLVDEEDRNRVAMVYDGNPHFVISRPGGKPVIHMTAAAQGDASLLFTHIDGRHNSAIGLKSNGDAILIQEKGLAEDKGK